MFSDLIALLVALSCVSSENHTQTRKLKLIILLPSKLFSPLEYCLSYILVIFVTAILLKVMPYTPFKCFSTFYVICFCLVRFECSNMLCFVFFKSFVTCYEKIIQHIKVRKAFLATVLLR